MTARWCPVCPACGSDGGVRADVRRLALDCHCGACGWYYTSELKGSVLRALTRDYRERVLAPAGPRQLSLTFPLAFRR